MRTAVQGIPQTRLASLQGGASFDSASPPFGGRWHASHRIAAAKTPFRKTPLLRRTACPAWWAEVERSGLGFFRRELACKISK